ncbi:MAG: hypothetical protein RL653_2501 [Pseudomonadota bacterium]|jgi:hypothetical protein
MTLPPTLAPPPPFLPTCRPLLTRSKPPGATAHKPTTP